MGNESGRGRCVCAWRAARQLTRPTSALWNHWVQFWLQNYALLLVWIGARANEDRWGRLAEIDRHVRYAGRYVKEFSGVSNRPLFELVACPYLRFVTADHVKGR